MSHDLEKMAARAAPAIFVVLWSTGFVATKYVVNNADPMTYLTIRMGLVVGLMAVIAALAPPKWPDRVGGAPPAGPRNSVAGFFPRGAPRAARECIFARARAPRCGVVR